VQDAPEASGRQDLKEVYSDVTRFAITSAGRDAPVLCAQDNQKHSLLVLLVPVASDSSFAAFDGSFDSREELLDEHFLLRNDCDPSLSAAVPEMPTRRGAAPRLQQERRHRSLRVVSSPMGSGDGGAAQGHGAANRGFGAEPMSRSRP
jgi:hypothetical protein